MAVISGLIPKRLPGGTGKGPFPEYTVFTLHSSRIWTSVLLTVSHVITNWIVRDKMGAIKYDQGFIIVGRTGHYFIYSQMYYNDARTHLMAHQTYVNNERVMESVGSALTDSTKDNTRYHGGVFLLRVNDTISVRIPYLRQYNMKSDASFFGTFLLYPGESPWLDYAKGYPW